uniref:PSI domain-containing protein n=1 Tax=Chromera velia CCMP2878 TaxID=1169474 RepID=A0A0G4GDR6_9ALVE|eukprot:Cvel_4568.t1-p1 / transcript=Cvel_4568.t1 / gene=Cvel_4568 / organism=Chromera_velia_CCMP2878 / gene_product=Attractin-like protein 1, putative / transcript_product=Attractin-like protein 1, putative / location=Cvel_scaffold200:88146-100054(-) / protein_length=682 / sequence_SO=supercontig / SO=protein_coding / is_pseudo=false
MEVAREGAVQAPTLKSRLDTVKGQREQERARGKRGGDGEEKGEPDGREPRGARPFSPSLPGRQSPSLFCSSRTSIFTVSLIAVCLCVSLPGASGHHGASVVLAVAAGLGGRSSWSLSLPVAMGVSLKGRGKGGSAPSSLSVPMKEGKKGEILEDTREEAERSFSALQTEMKRLEDVLVLRKGDSNSEPTSAPAPASTSSSTDDTETEEGQGTAENGIGNEGGGETAVAARKGLKDSESKKNVISQKAKGADGGGKSLESLRQKCGGYRGCNKCTDDDDCGWCVLDMTCVPGKKSGPLNGECQNFEFSSCSGLSCEMYTNCEECTSDMQCGWCASAKRCIEGSHRGPAYAVSCPVGWTHMWSSYKCDGGPRVASGGTDGSSVPPSGGDGDEGEGGKTKGSSSKKTKKDNSEKDKTPEESEGDQRDQKEEDEKGDDEQKDEVKAEKEDCSGGGGGKAGENAPPRPCAPVASPPSQTVPLAVTQPVGIPVPVYSYGAPFAPMPGGPGPTYPFGPPNPYWSPYGDPPMQPPMQNGQAAAPVPYRVLPPGSRRQRDKIQERRRRKEGQRRTKEAAGRNAEGEAAQSEEGVKSKEAAGGGEKEKEKKTEGEEGTSPAEVPSPAPGEGDSTAAAAAGTESEAAAGKAATTTASPSSSQADSSSSSTAAETTPSPGLVGGIINSVTGLFS